MLTGPLSAAECGYFNASHEVELTHDERVRPQTVTINGIVCGMEPDMDGDYVWALSCADGSARSLEIRNVPGYPSVFVVDGEEFIYNCFPASGVELQPAFKIE